MTVLIRSATLTHYPQARAPSGSTHGPCCAGSACRWRASTVPTCAYRPPRCGACSRLLPPRPASRKSACCWPIAARCPNLGPVALIVREQATVGDALKALSRFIHIHHEGMRLSIEDTRTSSRLASACAAAPSARRASQRRWRSAACTGSSVRSPARTGGRWKRTSSTPPPRYRKYYRSFFGCTLIFNAEADALLIAARDLMRPIPSAIPADRELSAETGRGNQRPPAAVGRKGQRGDPRVARER